MSFCIGRRQAELLAEIRQTLVRGVVFKPADQVT